MHFQRRQLFRILPFAFGSSFLMKADKLSIAAQVTTPPSGATETEKVTGIGGLFFRAHDPAALGRWYQEHLGVLLTPTSHNQTAWRQEAGTTAFTPFSETSGYFGDTQKDWMVNFRVRDIDKMAAQLLAAGIAVKVDPQSYPVGRFARLHDPEGNPIELWQPA
jgi:glyoxylase I family protein